MISTLRTTLSRNITNARGWRTDKKIVVIESDDWGSIRMPGKEIYSQLQKTRLGQSLSLFDSLDSLERREDFQKMLELADGFRDSKNNPLVITLNTVMQNPNFQKIKETGYNEFHGIPFFQSYQDYYGENFEDLWVKGIEEKLIKPQFHAREHLNEFLWLNDLRAGFTDVKIGFDYGFFGSRTVTSSKLRKHYLATYFSETQNEYKQVKKNTIEGLKMFENVFGFSSNSFIACNYTWPRELEEILFENGVKSIQSQPGNNITDFNVGIKRTKRFYTGKKNVNSQVFTVRNVVFEPSMNPKKDWLESVTKQIDNAFFWKKPAIISMHRVNLVSEMSVENRDRNLQLLKELIFHIQNKYPEIEFMNSEQLGHLIFNG